MTTVDALNTDCLSQIFLNLSFVDRVKIESVCQAWNSVLQQQSCFKDMVALNFADYLCSCSTEYYQQESLSFGPTVLGIVERCGVYVKDLSFGQRWLKISQEIMDSIATNCHRLRVIDLGAVILNADISPLLDKVAPVLEEFSLEETSWVNEAHSMKVQSYFPKMTNLKKLNLHSAMFKLNQLDRLPGNLKFVDIGGAKPFASDVFARFLTRQQNLHELHVAPIPVVDSVVLLTMGQLPRLQVLNIGYSHQIEHSYDPLAGLARLKTLRMQSLMGINEVTLRLLLSNMTQLETLSIRNCRNIHDYTSLGLCTSLSTLEITDTMQFADEDYLVLCTYGKLKRLSMVNCFNLSTRGVNIASTRCQLKELVVNKCSQVNDEMMYMLASTQRELESISLQGCSAITSKGVAALGWLRNILLLREIDISRNRNIDDTVVTSLHNALTMAYRRDDAKKFGYNDDDPCCGKITEKKLLMYIFDTSITSRVEDQVNDLITLC